jgi:spore germination protein
MIQRFGRRSLLLLSCITCLLLQTGCWSKDEIEDLGVYVGMALDSGEPTKLETRLNRFAIREMSNQPVTLTIQIVNKQAEGGGAEKNKIENPKPYVNITGTGDSLIELLRGFATRLERPIIGHHLKLIVINDSVARQYSMPQLTDFLLRDNDIRQNCAVLISNGLARAALEAKGNAIIPAFRLQGMIDNRYRTLKIIEPLRLYKLEALMHAKSSYLIQNVVSADGEVRLSGAAVIDGKTQKLKGTLNEAQLLGITWLRGDGKGGLVKAVDPESQLGVTYELKSMRSKIHSFVEGEAVSFHVAVESEGRITEDWSQLGYQIDEAFIKRMEKALDKQVEHLIKLGLSKTQHSFKTDVVGFGKRLSIEHPRLWKQKKENWDAEFANVSVTYSVKLHITETGTEMGH